MRASNEQKAYDDKLFMKSVARLTKEYGSGLSARIVDIIADLEENGTPMSERQVRNSAMRLKSRHLLSNMYQRVRENFTVGEDGVRRRTIPVRNGIILTILGWKELEKLTKDDV